MEHGGTKVVRETERAWYIFEGNGKPVAVVRVTLNKLDASWTGKLGKFVVDYCGRMRGRCSRVLLKILRLRTRRGYINSTSSRRAGGTRVVNLDWEKLVDKRGRPSTTQGDGLKLTYDILLPTPTITSPNRGFSTQTYVGFLVDFGERVRLTPGTLAAMNFTNCWAKDVLRDASVGSVCEMLGEHEQSVCGWNLPIFYERHSGELERRRRIPRRVAIHGLGYGYQCCSHINVRFSLGSLPRSLR